MIPYPTPPCPVDYWLAACTFDTFPIEDLLSIVDLFCWRRRECWDNRMGTTNPPVAVAVLYDMSCVSSMKKLWFKHSDAFNL